MRRRTFLASGMTLIGCGLAATARRVAAQAPWQVLFDGKSLDHWTQIGTANWRLEDGAVVADKGGGFLVSKESYADFEIRAEFWVNDDANSGIFIRCQDPAKVGGASAYEVNIFDKRPQPEYGTGAIVNVAKVVPMPKAGGKWNTYDITAKGPRFSVILNGQKTVDNAEDHKFSAGHIALQYGAGAPNTGPGIVKFRKVEIRRL